jgi:hypothetical protein
MNKLFPFFKSALPLVLFLLTLQGYAQSETKVYITKTGAKYHKSSCRYAQTGWAATLTEAKDKGLTACLVCKPGGGEASTSSSPSSGSNANALKSTTPSTSAPKSPTTTGQCKATTKAGSRCSRNASAGSSYCWQHAG